MMKKPAETVELNMEALLPGGDCRGTRSDDPTDTCGYIVPYGVPGDEIIARIDQQQRKDKSRNLTAELVKVVKPSADRVQPRCTHFGSCGGCQWQNIDISLQERAKEDIVKRVIGKAIGQDAIFKSITSSPAEYYYRCRATLHAGFFSGRLHLGFQRVKSHRLVDLKQCPVLMPELEKALPALRMAAENVLSQKQKEVTIMAAIEPETGRVAACLSSADKRKQSKTNYIVVENGYPVIADDLPPELTYEASGIKLTFLPGLFTQANLLINQRLVDEVLDSLSVIKPHSILDLYSGIGNYALPAARRFGPVHGIEQSARAVGLASRTAKVQELPVTFSAMEVMTALDRMKKNPDGQYEAVICNPPRTGLEAGVVDQIVGLKPRGVVYVSCSPHTLGRDLGLFQKADYIVRSIAPFDLFPQTFHVETVALLERQI